MKIYRVTRTFEALVLASDRDSALDLADQVEMDEYADDTADELGAKEATGAATAEPGLLLYHAGDADIRLDEAVQRYIDPDYPVAPPPDDPKPSAWIDWRGERWATDGYVLVREGTPRPEPNRYRKWRELRMDEIDQARRWLDAAAGTRDPASAEHLGRLGREYAPLVEAADVRSAPWPDNDALIMLAAFHVGRLSAVTSVVAEDLTART